MDGWMDGNTPPLVFLSAARALFLLSSMFFVIFIHIFHPHTTANAQRREREKESSVGVAVCVCVFVRGRRHSRDEERSRDEAALRPPLRLQLDRSAKREEICAAWISKTERKKWGNEAFWFSVMKYLSHTKAAPLSLSLSLSLSRMIHSFPLSPEFFNIFI